MSVDEPSGATSHRRTATSASGPVGRELEHGDGPPSSSSRSASGSDVKHSEPPSSARWSAG